MPNLAGLNIPGLPPDMMQNIISSVLQQHGHRQGQPVQINVVPVPVGGQMPASGMGGQIPLSGLGGQMPQIVHMPNPIGISIPRPSAPPPTPSAPAATSSATTVTSSASASTASVNTTSTATSAARTSTTAGAGQGARGPRLMGPMFLGDGGAGHSHGRPVDPFLPCNSHHFLAQRTRNMATQTNQGPENSLSDMVSNLMTGLLGGANVTAPAPAPASAAPGGPTSTRPTPTAPPHRATTHTTSAQPGPIPANPFASLLSGTFGGIPGMGLNLGGAMPRPAAPSGGGGGEPAVPNIMQTLRDMLQRANPQAQQATPAQGSTGQGQTQGSTGQGQTQGSTGQGQAQAAMSDDAFTRLVSGIGSYMSQAAMGQEAQDTLSDFLSTLGDAYTPATGEGFISDVFQCLSRHITFSDLFQVFFGNPEPLSRLRTPLQEFVRERILRGATFNTANMEAGIERIVEEMSSEIDDAVSVVGVKDGIDLNMTLRNLFRKNLLKICRQIMESPENDTEFGRRLNENVRRLLEEFVVLTPGCLVEGGPAFERMLHSRLRHMTAGMNPLIQQWMISMTSQQVQNFSHNVSVSQDSVQHYIVRKSGERPKDKGTAKERSESPMETGSPVSAGAHKTPPNQKPAIPPKPASLRKSQPSSTPLPSAIERGKRTFVNGAGSDGASPSHSASPTSPPIDDDDSWQGVVPADWVPIINRDVSRQRENGVQPPLSDIYMQGMPPKRRRIMSMERPNNLGNMAEYVPESIKRAAAAAGVQPISSMENLANEASEDAELHNVLEEEVQRVLSRRLQNDSDYNSDKFPSSKEFYNKHDDKI